MPIYTKAGDGGTTTVYGGRQILKSDLQIKAYGSVDELTSFIGLVIEKLKDSKEKKFLTKIQKDLYQIMACLSGAKTDLKRLERGVVEFEREIDKISSQIPKLNRFILPQGSEIAALYHIVRSVCRRTERDVIEYGQKLRTKNLELKTMIKYLNRISDLFFSLARRHTKKEIST